MMDLERLAAALEAGEVVGPAPVEVLDLAYDARHVTPGAAFFCVPGARADGHDQPRVARDQRGDLRGTHLFQPPRLRVRCGRGNSHSESRW